MAKKFNIHDWRSKQIKNSLQEQDDFTPDLEKDALQRDKIRQMMDKEKTDRTLDYKGGAVLGPKIAMLLPEDYSIKNFARDIGGVIEVEYGKHNIKAFLDELEDYFSIYSDDERSLEEDELDEANVTGTAASFNAGPGAQYATPKAFGNSKKKKKGYMGYKEI